MRRAALLGAVFAMALLALPTAAEAALKFRDCDRGGFRCTTLSVPLDRAGQVKGRVALRVLRARARGRSRGTIVLLAGGPGQSAVSAYADSSLGPLAGLRRTHDIVVFDQRGSGRSGLLRCPELEKANILRAAGPAARCAAKLGLKREFYASRDTADDMEALRRALGAPQLSLYGVSYGTRTATAYALRYPTRVSRMVLDSVVTPDGADALSVDSFRAVPRVLRALCAARRCARVTRDPVADLAALVQRIRASGPLKGRLPGRSGRPRAATLSDYDVFSALVSGDFEPAMRTAYPGAVKAAVNGDPAPLLRLKRRAIALESEGFEPEELSTALYAATTCAETKLPWPRSAPAAQRRPLAATAVNAIAPALVAPFAPATLLGGDVLDLCSRWPATTRDPVPGPGPLPDVPTLLVEGGDDLRTPVETARDVAAGRSRTQLVTVGGTGHSPGSTSACAGRLTARFLSGRAVTPVCRGQRPQTPTPPPPASLKGLSPLTAVGLSLDDLVGDIGFGSGVGLRAGRYALNGDTGALRVNGFSFIPGLRLTGRVSSFDSDRRRRGSIRVGGARGYRGVLRFRGTRVSGRLGGRRVRARLGVSAAGLANQTRANRVAGVLVDQDEAARVAVSLVGVRDQRAAQP